MCTVHVCVVFICIRSSDNEFLLEICKHIYLTINGTLTDTIPGQKVRDAFNIFRTPF